MVTLLIIIIVALALWVAADVTRRRPGGDPGTTVEEFNRALGALQQQAASPRRLPARDARRP